MRPALIAVTLGGCYAPDVPDCTWTCATSPDDCPSGQSCIAGVCRSDPDENVHCEGCPGYPTSGRPDGFALATSAWTRVLQGGAFFTDGRLWITPSTSGPSSPELISTFTVLLDDRAVFVQLLAPATTADDPPVVASSFSVRTPVAEVRLEVAGDRTIFAERVGMGEPGPVGMRDYDPARMRILRIRETAGTLYLEALADGNEITGTVIHQEPTPGWLATSVNVVLGASSSGPTGPLQSPAFFDNFDQCP